MRALTVSLAGLLVIACGPVRADLSVPLQGLSPATTAGLQARMHPGQSGNAVRLVFAKTGEERRFIGLAGSPGDDIAGARTLRVRYRLRVEGAESVRMAALLLGDDGARWLKVGAPGPVPSGVTTAALSLSSLQAAAFSEAKSNTPDLSRVHRAWVGVVVDGKVSGTLDLLAAAFSDAPPRAAEPLRITDNAPDAWELFCDPATGAIVTTPDEGPEGQRCMKLQLTFPGGRHMFANPHVAPPLADLEGYSALRLRYKAELPAGISGLLVMLGESGGGTYRAEPMPPPSDEWVTLTVPFPQMRLGEWCSGDNAKLDLDRLEWVFVGVHGTATGDGGPATIWATDIEFVP